MNLKQRVTRKRGRPVAGNSYKLPHFTKGCINLQDTLELWAKAGINPTTKNAGYPFILMNKKDTIELIQSCIELRELYTDSGIELYSNVRIVSPPIDEEDLWTDIENGKI